MDFLTVDAPLCGKRFYVFFIICLETRKIVRFRATVRPERAFVRNQLYGFMYDRENTPCLIHDGSGEFVCQRYDCLGIKNVRISPCSPNMNAFAERFIGSLRRECLNNFIIFSYDHLCSLLR
ncbi:MAG: transposase [Candidatus Atribacteria bacterium]|nr:transposase [Candidatus Atribacteria bacterium]